MSTVKINLQKSNTPSGWEGIRDVVINNGDELDLDHILKDGEKWVSGAEMMKRAKKLGGLTGRAHADYLLAHQDEIPEEWRESVLIFAGCEYKDSGGRSRVPCLCFNDDQWRLYFFWLGNNFDDNYRLVRRK